MLPADAGIVTGFVRAQGKDGTKADVTAGKFASETGEVKSDFALDSTDLPKY